MGEDDRIEAAVARARGAAREIAGKITGDARLEAQGRAEKAEGAARMASAGPRNGPKRKT